MTFEGLIESTSFTPKLLPQALCLNDSIISQPELFIFPGKLWICGRFKSILHNRNTHFIPDFKRIEYPG